MLTFNICSPCAVHQVTGNTQAVQYSALYGNVLYCAWCPVMCHTLHALPVHLLTIIIIVLTFYIYTHLTLSNDQFNTVSFFNDLLFALFAGESIDTQNLTSSSAMRSH